MVINLATTGAASFPIWMEAHSGNASNKTVLISAAERMKKFCDALNDLSNNNGKIIFSFMDEKKSKLKTRVLSKELPEENQYNEIITYLNM